MKDVIGEMHRLGIDLLISLHNLRTTPSPNALHRQAGAFRRGGGRSHL